MSLSRFNLFQEEDEEDVQSLSTEDSSAVETPDVSTGEEQVQEAMFDAGFNNLRMKISQSLGEGYNVTNVFKGMGGKDRFEITSVDMPDVKTIVESTGFGCTVTTWNGPKMKTHFRGMALSMAADNIISLFENPELLLEEAVTNFSRFNSFFMEAKEEDDDDDDDEDLDDTINEIEDSSKENDDSDDDDNDDDIDTSSFGSDESDVQNEYDTKEIECLNNLIAAENDAMNDYFEAGKNTNTEVLRRLYADIGAEERFHAEQLIYAKCTITGEKYEPRDPKVKKEYEELLEMGMDEDTAASTAIDKSSITSGDDGDDSDIEKLEQEASLVETMLIQNEILSCICEHYCQSDMDNAMNVFIEAYIQESLDNYASAPKEVRKLQSPVKLAAKALKASVNGVIRMSQIIKDTLLKNKQRSYRKMEWIKKNGISGLFKNGIYLYFYDDKNNRYDTETPARYVDFLYRLSKNIAENCGLRLTAAAQHKTISNPIKFGSISEGLNQLRQTTLSKTKVVVTDKNKDMLAREFFGYTTEKISVAVKHGDNPTVHDSNNIYSRLELLTTLTKAYSQISIEILEQLQNFEGNVNSIYYKNRALYNKACDAMKVITDRYNQFIKGMAHDLKVIISMDNGLLEMTRKRDQVEQSGQKWDGPDIRANEQTPNDNNKYSKTTNMKRIPHKW